MCWGRSPGRPGAALPYAGGWTVKVRRALGDQAGFAMGWIDWVSHCAGLDWVAVTIGAGSLSNDGQLVSILGIDLGIAGERPSPADL